MKKSPVFLSVLAMTGLFAAADATAESAGRVLAVAGTATIEREGRQVPLQYGAMVESGDVLTVGDKSALQVRFSDESVVALRANSQFKIEDYRFDKNADTDRSFLGLLKGGMRTITGLIGKASQKNYAVRTTTSTIGIRGTHFAVVSCNNDCMRPDGTPGPNGTFGGVADGKITVSNQAGTQEFGQQDFFHVATAGSPPVRLLAPPGVLADRGAVTRAPASAGEEKAAAASTGSAQGSSTRTSTSPQLTVQQAPATALVVPLTSVAASDQPAVVGTSGTGSGFITVVESRGFAGTGFTSAEARARNYSLIELRAEVSELSGTYFYDAASLAAALQRTRTVGYSAAAAAYWIYDKPDPGSVNSLGSHHAFGETPTVFLPGSGIAQYNFVGGTAPTDNYGRVGTFSGANLAMDFGARKVSTLSAMTISFGTNALQTAATVYSIPNNTSWAIGGGPSTLAGTTCTTGCAGATVGNINGRFVGTAAQGYVASITVTNTQLTTGQNNAVGTVAAFAKQ